MSRKSIAIEELARDALYDFLVTLGRRPLASFLRLYFPEGVPAELARATTLNIGKEVPTNLQSRADLVISRCSTLLVIEVKVDAVEKIGQYSKYKQHFEARGFRVSVGGLINRVPKSRTKENTAFFNALGFRRVSWFDVIEAFRQEFGDTADFRSFHERLLQINPTIGAGIVPLTSARAIRKEPELLLLRNDVLCEFYKELLPKLLPMEGAPWQDGNSPYCLTFGKRSWEQKFSEPWFQRCFLCPDKEALPRRQFRFGVMLWNRSSTKNMEWFNTHRHRLVGHFVGLGFDVGRNDPSTWHRRVRWDKPYDINRLKYVNATWPERIDFQAAGALLSWNDLLNRSASRCFEFAAIIDAFDSSREDAKP